MELRLDTKWSETKNNGMLKRRDKKENVAKPQWTPREVVGRCGEKRGGVEWNRRENENSPLRIVCTVHVERKGGSVPNGRHGEELEGERAMQNGKELVEND